GLKTSLEQYTYWSETAAQADYPIWWRHPNSQPTQRECLLDLEARASAAHYLDLGDLAISPDERWLAWTEDTRGDEFFDLYLQQLPKGQPRRLLSGIGADICWAEDNLPLLYTRYADTQRPASLWRLQ